MRTKNPGVAATLFTKTQQRVIGLLFGSPQRSFYANEIVRHAQAGIGAVQRELARLAAAGLLTVKQVGNQKHYQADPAATIFDELVSIAGKTLQAGTAAQRHAVAEAPAAYVAKPASRALVPPRGLAALCRRHHIRRLGVFGSAARGELRAHSDVDLLVEFAADAATGLFDMVRIRDDFARLFGRPVDLITATALENPYRRSAVMKDLRVLYAG